MRETLAAGVPTDGERSASERPTDWSTPARTRRLRRRHAAERRFRLLGFGAVVLAAGFLLLLVCGVAADGIGGFRATRLALPIDLAGARLDIAPARVHRPGADLALAAAGLERVVDAAALHAFGPRGPDLIADDAWVAVRAAIRRDPGLLRRRAVIEVPASDVLDGAAKGRGTAADRALAAQLRAAHRLRTGFAGGFLADADATQATRVGIGGALKGSLLTGAVTLVLAVPIGLFAALWLEEFAPRRRWTTLIEVSINNLAAVPSILFGLLGLAVFLGTLGLPRSAPLVGGLTLALMTMPVIVITARSAIGGVAPSVREAALGIGASPVQVVFHHVLPLALPGIVTGTIIGMARALGETAPLLLIGMRAFVASPPRGLTDPATVLPVQIFLWSDQVDRGFVEKTSAAMVVLLVVLLAMNGVAATIRHRFEARR